MMPRLAQDQKLDLTPVLRGITRKNVKQMLPAIVGGVRAAARDKLALDADLEDLDHFLDAIIEETPRDEDMPEEGEMGGGEMGGGEMGANPEGEDDEPVEALAKAREFLKEHVSPEIMSQFDEILGNAAENPAGGEPPPPPGGEEPDMTDDEPPDFPGKPELVTKSAMDEAIQAGVAAGRRAERSITEARDAVRPYVGELKLSFDSAEQVYRHTLKMLNVKNADKMHEDALRPILDALPRPGAKRVEQRLAADAAPAGATSFDTRFPATARITQL
jgi:hypothetical protein